MPLLTAAQLTEHLSGLDDAALTRLLQARPDLLRPTPGDFLGLAVRVQSELSLRQYLQHLDARMLSVVLRTAEAAEHQSPVPDDVDPAELDRLQAHAVVLPADPATPGEISVPAHLPHVLESLPLPAGLREAPESPPGPDGPTVPAGLVHNASLSAIGELLGAVEDVLTVLEAAPAATLRTGGVGMRELKRVTTQRTAERRTSDAEVGETGWLLELAAAAALIELDVDTGQWRPTPNAQHWVCAARHRKHQLLVSGWRLAPRAPLLLRGPHPTARLAPALTAERHRGDAPALRNRLLRTAAALTDGTSAADQHDEQPPAGRSPTRIWQLRLPDDELPDDDALTGSLPERLGWERPLLAGRVAPLLAPVAREAERLGLLAAGALSEAGQALISSGEAAMADVVEAALPPLSEALHLQSDLTAISAGPLTQQVSRAMAEIAERESRGGVATYRFTGSSLAAALCRGWTAETLEGFLTRHSLSELPSSLRTLIADAARTRHGVRIGGAGSWLLEDDPQRRAELLAQPQLRQMGLRALTEEVLVCDASADELARAVRRCGIDAHLPEADRSDGGTTAAFPDGPAPESLRGSVHHVHHDAAAAWTLTGSPWQQSPVRTLSAHRLAEDPDAVGYAVTTLRSGGIGGSPERAADDVVARLRTAARGRRPVRVARVSADGHEHRMTGVPLALNAGRVRLRTSDGEDESVLLLHRVTSVEML